MYENEGQIPLEKHIAVGMFVCLFVLFVCLFVCLRSDKQIHKIYMGMRRRYLWRNILLLVCLCSEKATKSEWGADTFGKTYCCLFVYFQVLLQMFIEELEKQRNTWCTSPDSHKQAGWANFKIIHYLYFYKMNMLWMHFFFGLEVLLGDDI